MTESRQPASPERDVEPGHGEPTAVRFTLDVAADLERTFRIFTAQMGTWWPAEHHINDAPMAAVILEPRVGGRWYELGTDGSECEWGVVLAYDPPHHVALSWHLDGNFRVDPDRSRSSRIDVRFRSQPSGLTRVELEHTGLDSHGPTWRRLRAALASPDGWPGTLRRFVAVAGR